MISVPDGSSKTACVYPNTLDTKKIQTHGRNTKCFSRNTKQNFARAVIRPALLPVLILVWMGAQVVRGGKEATLGLEMQRRESTT
jgi:hypothetical protein